jgi:hypothetical protein
LLLAGGNDEISTRQGRKVPDEWVISHEIVEVNIRRQRNGGGARRDIDHLAAPSILKLLGIFNQGKPRTSFQDDQLVPAATHGFHDYGCTGNRDSYSTRPDPAAA